MIPIIFLHSSVTLLLADSVILRSRNNFVFAFRVESDVLLVFHLFRNGYFELPRNESARYPVSIIQN